MAFRRRSPTHGARLSALWCMTHDAFPPFPPNKKEKKRTVEALLDIVINRLGRADSMVCLYGIISPPFSSTRGLYLRQLTLLITSLLSHGTDTSWDEFTLEIESLNVSEVVVWLMPSHTIEDLTSSILDFQANMARRLPPQYDCHRFRGPGGASR